MTSIAGDGTLPEDAPEEPTREWLESNRAPLPSRVAVPAEESEETSDDQATVSGPPQARTLNELGENVDGFPLTA